MGIGKGSPAKAMSSYRAVLDAHRPHRGRKSLRLQSLGKDAQLGRFGAIANSVSAIPYRGRHIRLTAAVRADAPGAQMDGLWMRVDRAKGRLGFFDNMADRSVHSPKWSNYVIDGDVSVDAERIVFGALLAGPGRLWVDDFRLEDLGPAKPLPHVTPAEYLDKALQILREYHVNSAKADWPTIIAKAHERAASAIEFRDTYDAIRGAIRDLGEWHTMLLPPAPPDAKKGPLEQMIDGGREKLMPTAEMVDGRYGLIQLPAFYGSQQDAKRYADAIRNGLQSLDRRGVCGWLVDLRANGGGNMWPMLTGLGPLLGKAPFGKFRTPSGLLTYWVRKDGQVAYSDAASDEPTNVILRSAGAPLAILFGGHTFSSGEMTAIALIGRPNTRSFGAPSGGSDTSNTGFMLPDGAQLLVTNAYASDRTGHEYHGPMIPDEQTGEAAAQPAAIKWLAQQPCH